MQSWLRSNQPRLFSSIGCSSSILRADLSEEDNRAELAFQGYELLKSVRRKILPRRPFDGTLDQDCLYYRSSNGREGLVILLPLLQTRSEESVPFYHPKVAGVAFRYSTALNAGEPGRIQVDFLPLEEGVFLEQHTPDKPYWSETSRHYRTALALLTTIHKHGKGLNPGQKYVKRVHHDTIVPREPFQDLYLVLKEKYTWILSEWKEATDPVKHVFEVKRSSLITATSDGSRFLILGRGHPDVSRLAMEKSLC